MVGGSGSIAASGNTTTINQSTQNMAIDWQSYNVNANERVQYIQPNSSSISLNRILSQNGSTIAGRIDANGQVILVNPNGIFFTPTSIINVGGIIASGLDIQPNDFMNGNYIFDEVLGTDGAVINRGMINASLGGNVALIGKQVKNDGLIIANLGTVNLAAGKQVVLTFDDGGLLGVRVSKEILQDELGVDPAVLNGGEINAEGGRVLLTASTSQDVFSQAVNTGELDQPTSVVIHEDGSFTLGSGADVINTGSIDTSTTSSDQNLSQSPSQNIGRIVLLGENVTNSGQLLANATNGNGGDIELHAQDTTLLTENSLTSARSESNGQGGIVKVLGDNVGLFAQATVDASGANGGGQVFIGGDQEGNNALIPNSEFIYLSENSQVFADALDTGNGGRLITFATDTARIYGDLFARGGINGGDGGFIETSGLIGFQIMGAPDASAPQGEAGTWLIDPYNITVTDSSNNAVISPDDGAFVSNGSGDAEIAVSIIKNTLLTTNVIIRTQGESAGSGNGDITFDALGDLDYDGTGSRMLTLDAAGDITFEAGSRIFDGNTNGQDSLNVELWADGAVILEGVSGVLPAASIITQGGAFTVGTETDPVASFTNNGTVDTSGAFNQNGGNITITTSGALTTTGLTANGGMAGIGTAGQTAGSIALSGGSITLNGDLSSVGSVGNENNTDGDGASITLDGSVILANTVTLDARGNTSGGISFNNTLNGTGNLTLYGNEMIFSGSVGDSTRLGSLMVNATGNVNANTITATSLTVNQSTGFTSGDINTAGATSSDVAGGAVTIVANTAGAENTVTIGNIDTVAGTRNTDGTGNAGGAVIITGRAIVIGSLDTTGGLALGTDNNGGGAGAIEIIANEGTGTETVPSITLNGDITAVGGAGSGNGAAGSNQTAALSLTSTTTATTTINYQNNFTSAITLTGSSGTDTLNSAKRTNNWALGSTTSTTTPSTLNGNLSFTSIETLTGNALVDTFVLADSGEFTGSLDGQGGVDEIRAGNRANSWNITGDDIGTVTGINDGFNEIEILTGNDNTDDFTMGIVGSVSGSIDGGSGAGANTLTGRNTDTTWDITSTTNTLAETSGGTTTTYVTGFTNINILTGGTAADTFDINADFTGTINGDSVTGAGQDTFNVNSLTGFSGSLYGRGGNDDFNILQAMTGTVNGGAGNDIFDISADSGTLNGDGGDDTFTILQPSLSIVLIDGGGEATETNGDKLIAANETNYWTVNSANGGAIYSNNDRTTRRVAFSNMETLTGNTGIDDFLMGTSGTIAQIDGGSGPGTNTLTGRNTDTTWNITAAGTANTLTDTSGSTSEIYVANVTNINILNGGNAADTFDINANFSGTINGGQGSDNFNIQTTGITFTGTLNGGADSDTLTAANEANYWTVNAINGGAIYSDSNRTTRRVAFSNMETLTGGTGTDNFLISNNGTIAQINGGGGTGTNTLTARNNANEWNINADNAGTLYIDNNTDGFGSAYVNGFTNIQNLIGGTAADRFVMGSNGTISGTLDGGSTSSNTLVSRQDVTNIWNFAIDESGTLTQSGESTPYVNVFTHIQNYVGGGGSNEWADFSANTGTVDINANRYFGFTGIIGNGANSTLNGQDGQTNSWVIDNVAATPPAGNVDGVNDGSFDNANVPGAEPLIFIDFANLVGGNANDTFTIVGTSSVASINGGGVGTGGTDSIQGPGGTEPVTWTLNSTDSTLNYGTSPLINFTNIQTLTGGAGNDIFAFPDMLPEATGMTFSGQAGIDTTDLSALTGSVTVSLNQYATERIIGNNINSTFSGTTGTNTWTITPVASSAESTSETDGQNDGTITNGTDSQTFIGFNNLTGGNGDDTFTIEAGGNLTGLLSGGGGNRNTLTVLNTTIANVEPESDTAGTPTNLNVTGLSAIIGNGTTTLVSDSAAENDWVITGTNTGTLNSMTFNDFSTLQGGTNNDTFTLSASIDFAGSINGGSTGTDEIIAGDRPVNNWAITGTNNTGTVTGLTGNFTNIETLTGNNQTDNFTLSNTINFAGAINGAGGTDQLTGGDSVNTWTITGTDAGNVTNLSNGFSAIETLVGGNQQDTFTLNNTATFTGTIRGGTQATDQDDRLVAGDRENDWIITVANNTGTVTGLTGDFTAIEFLDGNNQRDTLMLNDTDTFSGSFNGAGGIDEVIGGNTTNTWTITAANNTGTVTGLSGTFTQVETLTGTRAQDTFTLLAGTDFMGTINGGAGSQNDTLIGGATDNSWVIDGINGNTVTGLGAGNTFSNIQNLSGASGAFDDTFTFLNGGSLSGRIDGSGESSLDTVDMSALNSDITVQLGVGQDINNIERVIGNNDGTGLFNSTLAAENNDNTWSIDGTNDGTVDGVQFINFNNVQGGTRADTFIISSDGSITGLIDGGGPDRLSWAPGQDAPAAVTQGDFQTEDILDYSALSVVDIIIDTDFTNIELVKGNSDGTAPDNSTLRTGAEGNNNWLIQGTGTGVVNSTQFVDFNNIAGGNSNDTFVVAGEFGGSIRGGGGTGTDTVNYQALDTARVIFGGALGIAEIERIEGDGTGFTIVGQAGFDNAWTVSGVNQGTVTANGEALDFIGFDNIEGNNESAFTDTFTVQGGSMDGTVLGMAGDDVLIVKLTGTETGQILFNGGAGADTVRLQNGAATPAAYSGEYTAGITGGYDRLQYSNVVASTPRVFTLDYQQAGEIQDTLSADSLTINGTSGSDTIELGYDAGPGMNTFTVNGASPVVHYSNKDDLTVLGLAGTSDTVNITADPAIISGNGVLTINAETVTSTSTITANQLVLDSVVNLGSTSTPVDINVANLSLPDTAGAASQALYLQAQNGLTLTGLGEVEIVDITVLDGDFTNSAALITSSQLNISTNGTMEGNIVLTGNNRLSGAVTLNAANEIVFDGDNDFSGFTDFTAINTISSEGANGVSAAISLNATTINLSGNNQITAPITLGGTTAIINNTVATDLGDITVESLTVTSAESISDSGVINVQAAGTGVADLTSINGSIVLDNENNNFDEVRLNALHGAVIINESDGITITNTVVGDALTVTSNIGLAANDTAIGNMGLGSMTAATINLNANEGAIVSQSSNLTAESITLTAASGIGENKTANNINDIDSADSIRTTTPTLSAINLSTEGTAGTSGVINISNAGNVTVNDLRNYGDIRLENPGNITLSVTDNSGAIDAHYGGNISDAPYAGSVAILGTGSNTFSTQGEGTGSGNADIIAETLTVNNVSRFGTQTSPIGLRVNDDFTLLANQGVVYYLGNRPKTVTTTADLLQLAIRGFIGISSQQLIEVETLGDIDSAIFTEVRNYNHDDIAILLPDTQRYDDNIDEDEDENGK